MSTPQDAQEFVEQVAGTLEDQGYYAMASFLRSEMPDSDLTSMGGQGTEQIVGGIVEGFFTEHRDAIMEAVNQAVTNPHDLDDNSVSPW